MAKARTHTEVSSLVRVNARGEVTLGKELAGCIVQVESPETGVWLIRTVPEIPPNEAYLHTPAAQEKLRKALKWAIENPVRKSDPAEL